MPIRKKFVLLQQHTYLASHQISALKVSLFFSTMEYTKEPLPFDEQIKHLKSKGLSFADEAKALHTLQNISYFRLKSYLRATMYDRKTQTYKSGATFEQAYELYKFDSRLRKLIIAEMEKIEVSVRAQMACVSVGNSGAFWFSDSGNFTNQQQHSDILNALKSELDRSDDDNVLSFRNNYTNAFPPAWISLEVSSFGTLSRLYKLMAPGLIKRQIAKVYGVSDSVFESWLHSLVYVRNICAHHSRLWNRQLRIRPLFPRKTAHPFFVVPCSNTRVYYVLCIIRYLLATINPNTTFPGKLKSLLAEFPQVNVTAMGFPSSWENEPLWE